MNWQLIQQTTASKGTKIVNFLKREKWVITTFNSKRTSDCFPVFTTIVRLTACLSQSKLVRELDGHPWIYAITWIYLSSLWGGFSARNYLLWWTSSQEWAGLWNVAQKNLNCAVAIKTYLDWFTELRGDSYGIRQCRQPVHHGTLFSMPLEKFGAAQNFFYVIKFAKIQSISFTWYTESKRLPETGIRQTKRLYFDFQRLPLGFAQTKAHTSEYDNHNREKGRHAERWRHQRSITLHLEFLQVILEIFGNHLIGVCGDCLKHLGGCSILPHVLHHAINGFGFVGELILQKLTDHGINDIVEVEAADWQQESGENDGWCRRCPMNMINR